MIPSKKSRSERTFVCVGTAYAALAKVDWRSVLFWSALWWFIYSAPPEGLLTRTFIEPAHVEMSALLDGEGL